LAPSCPARLDWENPAPISTEISTSRHMALHSHRASEPWTHLAALAGGSTPILPISSRTLVNQTPSQGFWEVPIYAWLAKVLLRGGGASKSKATKQAIACEVRFSEDLMSGQPHFSNDQIPASFRSAATQRNGGTASGMAIISSPIC
jgi:hypothetical protein